MGDFDGGGTWKGFLALMSVCGGILLLGWQFGNQPDPKPVKVQLSCTTTDRQAFTCQAVNGR